MKKGAGAYDDESTGDGLVSLTDAIVSWLVLQFPPITSEYRFSMGSRWTDLELVP